MEFLVNVLRVKGQTPQAAEFLKANATHIPTRDLWLFEGDEWLVREEYPELEILGETIVPSLGGLSDTELEYLVDGFG